LLKLVPGATVPGAGWPFFVRVRNPSQPQPQHVDVDQISTGSASSVVAAVAPQVFPTLRLDGPRRYFEAAAVTIR
jgi:hypothetical protein